VKWLYELEVGDWWVLLVGLLFALGLMAYAGVFD